MIWTWRCLIVMFVEPNPSLGLDFDWKQLYLTASTKSTLLYINEVVPKEMYASNSFSQMKSESRCEADCQHSYVLFIYFYISLLPTNIIIIPQIVYYNPHERLMFRTTLLASHVVYYYEGFLLVNTFSHVILLLSLHNNKFLY